MQELSCHSFTTADEFIALRRLPPKPTQDPLGPPTQDKYSALNFHAGFAGCEVNLFFDEKACFIKNKMTLNYESLHGELKAFISCSFAQTKCFQ